MSDTVSTGANLPSGRAPIPTPLAVLRLNVDSFVKRSEQIKQQIVALEADLVKVEAAKELFATAAMTLEASEAPTAIAN